MRKTKIKHRWQHCTAGASPSDDNYAHRLLIPSCGVALQVARNASGAKRLWRETPVLPTAQTIRLRPLILHPLSFLLQYVFPACFDFALDPQLVIFKLTAPCDYFSSLVAGFFQTVREGCSTTVCGSRVRKLA